MDRTLSGQDFPTPQQLTRMRIASYRACGFSLAKAEAIRGIGRGSLLGTVPDLATASQMDDEQLITLLTQLRRHWEMDRRNVLDLYVGTHGRDARGRLRHPCRPCASLRTRCNAQ